MRRRGKGEGGLTRRTDGRWQASYVGSDARRHYLYGATRREASDKLSSALRDKELGVYVAGPSQSVAQFLAAYLADAQHRLRPRTHERYESLVRIHVQPTIGALPLRKVLPTHLSALYRDLRDRQAPASIAQLHNVLHGAFDQAVKWQLLARNPVDAVRPPKAQRAEMRVLSPEQARCLLDAAAGDELECLYVLALMTGARQGELLALRWRDVDLEAGSLSIQRNLVRVRGAWRLDDVKRPASRRTIVLNLPALEALRRHRAAMVPRYFGLKASPSDQLLFLTPLGEPVNGYHVTERHLKPLLRRAGLPAIRFHDLRHTAASLMLSAGAPVHVVSRMLGHSTAAITLSVYAHTIPGDQEQAVERLARVIGNDSGA